MDLDQAEQLARDLMAQHGLTRAGWRFAWSGGKRQLGAAMIRKTKDPRTGRTTTVKTIRLSRHLVQLNEDDEVRDTILHEIAHALAGLENGHNAKWKAVCRRIGAKPRRLAGQHVATPPPRYQIVCGVCGRALGQRYRRIDPRRLGEAYCGSCGRISKGTLRLRALITPPADPTAADNTAHAAHATTGPAPAPRAPGPDAPLFAASSSPPDAPADG